MVQLKGKLMMPCEEWEDFKTNCLDRHQLSDIEILRFKLVFLGALAASTDFFELLLSSGFSAEEAQGYYTRWRENLEAEMNSFGMDFVVGFLGGSYGRTH